jgi:hypothetical protein
MPPDALIEERPLILVGLNSVAQTSDEEITRRVKAYSGQRACNQLASSSGKSQVHNHGTSSTTQKRSNPIFGQHVKTRGEVEHSTYPFAGSHILLMNRSSVVFPPSLRALVMDLEPCSLVAKSRSPVMR